jgi:hypothetical protein
VLTTRRCLSPLLARRTARRRKELVDAVVRVPSVNLSSTARFRF